MTEHDQQHIDRICEASENRLRTKYEKGSAEHGGNLWEKPCLKFALDEVTDLVTYLHTAREQQAEAIRMLDSFLTNEHYYLTLPQIEILQGIYNLLKYGNKEGKEYNE